MNIVSETHFWSLLKSGDNPCGLQAKAVKAGQAGSDDAWQLLGRLHVGRSTERLRELKDEGCAAIKDRDKAQPIAFNPDGQFSKELLDRQLPVLTRCAAAGDPEALEWLASALAAIGKTQKAATGRPAAVQLSLYRIFSTFWDANLVFAMSGRAAASTTGITLQLIYQASQSVAETSKHYVVHNIFTAGNYGLLFVARTLPELKEAAAWDQLAVRNLATDFERSFYAEDGGHLERNWGYGLHTLRRLTRAYRFALQTGGLHGYEQPFADGLRRAWRFYARTLDQQGRSPALGDEGPADLSSALDDALASGLFPDGTPPDLGEDRGASVCLRGTKLAIFRNGASPDHVYGDINFGEFAGWHSHFDLLGFNLRRRDVLIEEMPRIGSYQHPLDHIARQPEAHNLLLADGYPFNSHRLEGENVGWLTRDDVDFFSAEHRAFRAIPIDEHRPFVASGDLIVRRTILFVRDPGWFLVMDSMRRENSADFNRATSLYWHSPWPFETLEPGRFLVRGPHDVCQLVNAQPETILRTETAVDIHDDDVDVTHHLPLYPSWHRLRLRTWRRHAPEGSVPGGALGFVSLLVPSASRDTLPKASLAVECVPGAVAWRAMKFSIAVDRQKYSVILNPEGFPDCADGELMRIDRA